ncbi:MAG: MerR family transcriptional regulator [Paracoccaceae bacterium]
MATIGKAARQSGLSIETIRFYERSGVVPKPDRSANNRRSYSTEQIGRLRLIRRLRDLGFGLTDAQVLSSLAIAPNADCHAVLGIAQSHIKTVRSKMAELRKFEAALVELTANCGDGRVSCPMLAQLCGNDS